MEKPKGKFEVRDLERQVQRHWAFACPGVSYAEEFTILPLKDSLDALTAAMRWAWVRWHQAADFDPISDSLSWFVRRSAGGPAKTKAEAAEWRGMHDWVLLAAAVLSGDWATMRAAADAAVAASTRARRPQYYEALAGILKARILGDPAAEAKQLDVLGRSRPNPEFIAPGAGLVRTFVVGDESAFARELVAGVDRHWSDKWLSRVPGYTPAVVSEEPGRLVLDLFNKHIYFFWAYPEAAFAKLAALSAGTVVPHDDFWFPRGLVAAERSPAPGRDPPAAAVPLLPPGTKVHFTGRPGGKKR